MKNLSIALEVIHAAIVFSLALASVGALAYLVIVQPTCNHETMPCDGLQWQTYGLIEIK